MARITTKRQVTIPKVIADQYGIRPGDEIEWVAAGETIRVVLPGRRVPALDLETRLRMFDAATERQRRRQAMGARRDRAAAGAGAGRGFTVVAAQAVAMTRGWPRN